MHCMSFLFMPIVNFIEAVEANHLKVKIHERKKKTLIIYTLFIFSLIKERKRSEAAALLKEQQIMGILFYVLW